MNDSENSQATEVRTYRAERKCPGCRHKRSVQVTVHDPWTVDYVCECGHEWRYAIPKATMKP